MPTQRGVVAAGHPLTAEAGAQVLREGGNAVDAAICAVLTSFVAESQLSGFGAGGFMMVHEGDEDTLVDFFVAAGGADGAERTADLIPIPVYFDETPQTFNCGAASCGVPGNPAGLEHVARRFGSMPLARLAEPGIRLGREGVRLTTAAEYFHEILHPILVSTPECADLYAPEGRQLVEGDTFHFPEMADALERFAAEGSEPFYRGDVARRVCDWVRERGGTLGMEDMAAYEPIERRPVTARFRGDDVLTNPPPSSGGILIAYSLGVLERLGERSGVEEIVAATEAANARRTDDFHEGLHDEAFVERFMSTDLDAVAERIRAGEWVGGHGGAGGPADPTDRLGSTTHIAVLDTEGNCASVTCSNGTGSGVLVPGTGVHVNNMLGEEDLNPHGFHRIPPGRRVSSMMAPTLARRDGQVVLGLGSAGSNRIRSAILQTVVRVLDDGMDAGEAVRAGRLHFEAGTVQAEPGVDEKGLGDLERRGVPVVRWKRLNLFFGGAQAVARDPATGELSGGGDPRRGGAVVLA
ncbi:MAG TPA: gamma-glutamyltransferase [Solirubrobacterales bacterium]|nr:gamma-glutamyltransferase [Solirubrobacterales bacterium]